MKYKMTNKKFDIDLAYGVKMEENLKEFFEGEKIEVKTERGSCSNKGSWIYTGNHAVEFRYDGKPSGIAVTEAEYWAIVLAEEEEMIQMHIIPTEKLKEITRIHYKNGRVVKGGDDNLSDLVLVPIKEIALACLNR